MDLIPQNKTSLHPSSNQPNFFLLKKLNFKIAITNIYGIFFG